VSTAKGKKAYEFAASADYHHTKETDKHVALVVRKIVGSSPVVWYELFDSREERPTRGTKADTRKLFRRINDKLLDQKFQRDHHFPFDPEFDLVR
jgi:hypothetical protein